MADMERGEETRGKKDKGMSTFPQLTDFKTLTPKLTKLGSAFN